MKLHFYKYQGTGNDFIMIDNRTMLFPKNDVTLINKLCDRRFGIGADGLILLEPSENHDFTMVYFNADGNEGSMCGNGGRCIVAFANRLGLIQNKTVFEATDGVHHASIKDLLVHLKMADVEDIEFFNKHTFIDTGSPHHIEFSSNIGEIDVLKLGEEIRNGAPYNSIGSNVNFAEQINENTFKVRTYERGVENETLACGTGVTAVAIAAHATKLTENKQIQLQVEGGKLQVSFSNKNGHYSDIYLTGPAEFVFKGVINFQ